MSRIEESLKKLSVENGTRKHVAERLLKCVNELTLMKEELVSDNNYVLAVCGTQCDPDFRIGAALADHSCVVYSVSAEELSRFVTLTQNTAPIVGIRFSPTSRNIIYTASSDGHITAFDLRAKGKTGIEFKDNAEGVKTKPLASFDISCDERLLAGGTEHVGGDAFILFWDIRYSNPKTGSKNNLLGGYWESHMDDVTCLSFHSNKRDALASGSTDGLINIFDLTQSSEEAALTYSLNTESSVDRLGWLNNENLWCTTHTFSLQLWDCDGATPYAKFDRNQIACLQNEDPDNCYLVRVHTMNTLGQPFLLAGSNNGKGEHLRCLNIAKDHFDTCYNILGNKQIVRDSWLHEKSGCLVSGGEYGVLNIWRQPDSSSSDQNAGHKLLAKIGGTKNREKQHRTKPY